MWTVCGHGNLWPQERFWFGGVIARMRLYGLIAWVIEGKILFFTFFNDIDFCNVKNLVLIQNKCMCVFTIGCHP